MLASILFSLKKYDIRLSKINTGYRAEKKKISSEKQLAQVLNPKPFMQPCNGS
jgi:hypothetical protein